ncbi:GlxA family transcriptional regulator [Roseobacter sp. YSTF-M11]|uniref:GlxA family transcriptional regulator n=1 Tax=Roseobacter insulae TaxID=2859783 RepID=A0A9X1FZ89_9RHOB|nr:GlxA family transcriptional regulator [Roseobacter insulae]MBW4710454.1 GlxA family transcriptional regulator [Roseobacter insulae]
MTSKAAKSNADVRKPRLVVFVVYPDIVLLDLVGPLQVFSHAPDPATGKNGYECAVVSVDGDLTETNTVVSIPSLPAAHVSDRQIHTLIVVGGDGAIPGMRDTRLVGTIAKLAARAQRVCSVCSGALVLAVTGLLDGRRAVTHWDDCAMLADAFPNVKVEGDPIFIKDDNIWTSAGITAGIDMALAIVSEDLGRASSFQVARSMVAQMVRSGGQSQFSPALGRQLRDGAGQFEALHAWIADHLHAQLSVEALADRANMSARNFARVYTRVMGITPAKAVEAIRIEKAQQLLEVTNRSIKQIAVQCGFNDEDRMRRSFLRLLNVSPSDYRQNFHVP